MIFKTKKEGEVEKEVWVPTKEELEKIEEILLKPTNQTDEPISEEDTPIETTQETVDSEEKSINRLVYTK